uniref:NADH-ubiquinone oxidoreductase chain 6 n=1 Tax=Oncocephalus breviscutum TaxID=1347735 RepID=U5JEL9_9HEMI|nr:NADH dehydrogenase subunit 6 [Oncocephalus breviscutum]AGO28010.1 NADH dehydrogenase subunit 6 [Oncocephalus breviscutum]
MMMMITSSMIISTMFMMMNHPLSMGLWLIMQTIMIALITGVMINMFWFSYILIITMLSGALVLFIYMASVASNEKFQKPMTIMTMLIPMMLLSSITLFMVDQLSWSKVWSTMNWNPMMNNELDSLLKMFNLHNMFITIMLVLYLFLTMIVISYIANTYEGPLRMKN